MTARSPIEFTDTRKRRVGNKVIVDNNIISPSPVQFGDSPTVDAFSRLRISEPISRLESQFTYNLQPLLYEQLTNGVGATIVHNATERCALMTFSSTPDGGFAYMQSYEWTFYHPGNSHLIFVTFNFQLHVPGVIKFAGYGDLSNNGIHFISNGSGFAWRILSNTNEGDQTILQNNWNLDKLDGTGKSGITLNVTKTQILVIDLQALYTGRVRVGFDINGVIVFCHEFNHANISLFPYIQTASLPIIVGMTASNTVSTTMLFVCATVRSEGADSNLEGFSFGVEGTATAANDTRTHILSVRPKTTFNGLENRINFNLQDINFLVTGNSPVLWELCVGQAISGTTAFNNVNSTYSAFEFNTAGTISGNPTIVVAQGYIGSGAATDIAFSQFIINRYPITLDAAGAVRSLGTLTLIVTGLGGASAMRANMNWLEVR